MPAGSSFRVSFAGRSAVYRAAKAAVGIVSRTAALLPFVLALTVGGLAADARAEITALIDARAEPGFGRMIFEFSELPDYEVTSTTGVLVVNFGEPVDISIEGVDLTLSDYLTIGRLDPDGSAVRFALAQLLRIHAMAAGNRLFVDLLPQNWSGPPPGLPPDIVAQLAREAEEAERRVREQIEREVRLAEASRIELRVGRQPTFTRLFFDWAHAPGLQAGVSRDGRSAKISFSRFGNLDLGPIRAELPDMVAEISADNGKDGFEVDITLAEDGIGLRAFPEDGGYVVDLARPVAPTVLDPGGAVLPDAGVAPGLTSVENTPTEEIGQTAKEAASAVPVTVQEEGVRTRDDGRPPLTEDGFAEPAAQTPPTREGVAALPADDGQSASRPPAEAPGPSSSLDEEGVTVLYDPLSTVPPAPPIAPQVEVINPRAEVDGASVRLIFPFTEATPGAVFTRARVVWLVFDTRKTIDLREIRRIAGPRLTDVSTTRTEWGQVIRLVLSKPFLTSAASDETIWTITLGDMVLDEFAPLEIRRTPRGLNETVVSADFPGAGAVHWVRDPVVGDRLAVVTALGPARGVVKPQSFVDFTAITTSHGIVVVPRSDHVVVDLVGEQVVVNRHGGLSLTPTDTEIPALRAGNGIARSAPNFINFEDWSHGDNTLLRERIAVLERAASEATDEELTSVRLALARLYLAHGFSAEAHGLILLASEDDPNIEGEPTFKALHAIADVLSGFYDSARKQLSDPALRDKVESKLWLGYADAMEGKWYSARTQMASAEEVIRDYPPTLQNRLRMLAARAAIETRDIANASFHVDVLSNTPLNEREEAMLDVLKGRLFELRDELEEAVAAYDKAIESTVRPAVAEAKVRRARLSLLNDNFDKTEAVEDLERVAVSWRGDEVELLALKTLADVYVSIGQHRRAFELMEAASIAQPDNIQTRAFQDRMAAVFEDLFLHGGADMLSVVDALALFYDFRTLTPIGRDGDEMIRLLADRLIDADLLDSAENLLSHQVANRLRGAARAQVAGKLAMVQLMNDRPAQALQTIRRSRQAVLPRALRRQRTILEARALAETGRADLGVELLRSIDGEDVQRVKADILWRAEHWQRAGEQIELNLGGRWEDGEPLLEAERQDVLRAAIAYSLAGDQLGLDRLGTKFAGKMNESPDGVAFQVVTRPIADKGVEFRQLVNNLANVDTLQRFLTDYKSRYGGQEILPSAVPGS